MQFTSHADTDLLIMSQSPHPSAPADLPDDGSRLSGGSGAIRVLVVDDEPEIRLLLRLILEQSECCMAFADAAEEALRCVERFQPELILLDVGLQGGPDGLSLCSTLKQAAAGAFPVVVMLTAADDAQTVARARGCGADGYLTKPFTPTQILGLLDSFDAWRIDPGRSLPEFWPVRTVR